MALNMTTSERFSRKGSNEPFRSCDKNSNHHTDNDLNEPLLLKDNNDKSDSY